MKPDSNLVIRNDSLVAGTYLNISIDGVRTDITIPPSGELELIPKDLIRIKLEEAGLRAGLAAAEYGPEVIQAIMHLITQADSDFSLKEPDVDNLK